MDIPTRCLPRPGSSAGRLSNHQVMIGGDAAAARTFTRLDGCEGLIESNAGCLRRTGTPAQSLMSTVAWEYSLFNTSTKENPHLISLRSIRYFELYDSFPTRPRHFISPSEPFRRPLSSHSNSISHGGISHVVRGTCVTMSLPHIDETKPHFAMMGISSCGKATGVSCSRVGFHVHPNYVQPQVSKIAQLQARVEQ